MQITNHGTRLTLQDGAGFSHEFHAFWLRESSTDPSFRDPNTGHKLLDAEDIPLDVRVTRHELTADALKLEFSDGHRSTYSLQKLRQAATKPRT
jgi:gamma-butyrobetaine dioxygenase